ncbi:urease accessory protein UreD [Phanerochaete sordida]|uniref:Urease accessory protein UreD n=1 Tax=Phanerochaete sordida TaxID=48140 RepID=A0A9P3G0K9_9APHY|nr:urease accessory protein UreD [Phanerochaete sordida]
MSTVEKVAAGKGRIHVRSDGNEAVLSELSYSYPLKLLSPRLAPSNVAIVYCLTYGGGLVHGDGVDLEVDVKDRTSLVLLTQGSTKVFKTRPGHRHAHPGKANRPSAETSQRMTVTVGAGSTLFLLPDPVTCFRSASYSQIQTFRLATDASAVLLDWITSGRKSLGEDWVFSKYLSVNEVFVAGRRVARDAMLLEEDHGGTTALPPRSLADRLAPYSCYATLILYGPKTAGTIKHLSESFVAITVFKHASRPSTVWSLTLLDGGRGCVLRVAAQTAEDVRTWLGEALRPLCDLIGTDVYDRTFGR